MRAPQNVHFCVISSPWNQDTSLIRTVMFHCKLLTFHFFTASQSNWQTETSSWVPKRPVSLVWWTSYWLTNITLHHQTPPAAVALLIAIATSSWSLRLPKELHVLNVECNLHAYTVCEKGSIWGVHDRWPIVNLSHALEKSKSTLQMKGNQLLYSERWDVSSEWQHSTLDSCSTKCAVHGRLATFSLKSSLFCSEFQGRCTTLF